MSRPVAVAVASSFSSKAKNSNNNVTQCPCQQNCADTKFTRQVDMYAEDICDHVGDSEGLREGIAGPIR